MGIGYLFLTEPLKKKLCVYNYLESLKCGQSKWRVLVLEQNLLFPDINSIQ